MEVSKEMIEEMREILGKKEGREITDQEAYEAGSNLIQFAELICEVAEKKARKDMRLKKEPGGFPVDGQYTCLICGQGIDSENGWYSWYGQTCLLCKQAIDDGVIPTFVATDHDSYFKFWHLKDKWKIHPATARKYVREGKIVARVVLTKDGKPHEHIFPKKENPMLQAGEKWNPVRKSYNRHRDKESRKRTREWIKETKVKYRAERENIRKRLKKIREG